MSNPVTSPITSRFYEALGRTVWAVGKYKVKQRVGRAPTMRYVAIGALALGVIGIGAIAARANGNA